MMIGEYEFADSFTLKTIRQSSVLTGDSFGVRNIFPVFVQLVFVAMIFLGSIIIANLITGLTIYNIGELYKEAEVFKLGSAVRQIDTVENMVKTSKFFGFLKRFFPPTRLSDTSIISKLQTNSNDMCSIEQVFTVCVKPNEFGTYDDSMVSITSSASTPIYIYDKVKEECGRELKMSIPTRIVKNTFEHLSKKEAMQKELMEAFRIEDSKSKMNLGTSSEEIYGVGKPKTRKSHVGQGGNELIYSRKRTLSGFPSQETVEGEDAENLDAVQENLFMVSTALKRLKINVSGKTADNRIKQALKENLEILESIISEAEGNSHL